MKWRKLFRTDILICGLLLMLAGCTISSTKVPDYTNAQMDFSAVRTVAVLPFQNLSADDQAAERVRDAFMGMLLATEAIYVLPPGEVNRGMNRANMRIPWAPTTEEITKLREILEVDAVLTGVLREYGSIRSGSAEANLVSLSLQMIETQTGSTVWSASSTKGGVTLADRMLGSGGRPMNDVTTQVINDLLDQLFE
ncbi:MAG: DUF799 family lipoprotein [Desulfuromonadales bacterium]|nr:DUF799 family lipoprotein [Desulfuromonadales bacterium]MBN2790951.1 DUF799 family lipoprotein [Desulfuromonadales bacterium]